MSILTPTGIYEQDLESDTSVARIAFTVDLVSLGTGALLSLIVVCMTRRLRWRSTKAA